MGKFWGNWATFYPTVLQWPFNVSFDGHGAAAVVFLFLTPSLAVIDVICNVPFPVCLGTAKNLIIIIDWHGNLIFYFHKPFIFCDAEGKSFSELKNSQMDKQHFSKWKNRLSYVLGLVETIWKKYFYCAKSYDIT